MAFEPKLRIYLIDPATSNYYSATRNTDDTYNVTLGSTPTPILVLPRGWQDIKITWDRDTTYMGVFTAQSQALGFVRDARYILLSLYYAAGGGIQADCIMRVDAFVDYRTGYATAYECKLNFSQCSDPKQNGDPLLKGGIFDVPTLNGDLNVLVSALGDKQFNIPMWTKSGSSWTNNADFGWHPGIKLLWNANYISAATTANPQTYVVNGFDGGDPSGGNHTLPSMNNYNQVQNNGTTTFIGNDILQPFLIQQNESQWLNEAVFDGVNNSQNSTKQTYLVKNLLVDSNQSGVNVDVNCNISITFALGSTINLNRTYVGGSLKFVLFEIGPDDKPALDPITGFYLYQIIYDLPVTLSTTPSYSPITSSVPVTLNYGKCYIVGIVLDNTAGGTGLNNTFNATFHLANLQVSFASAYNSGISAPVAAPSFPGSPLMGFYPYKILQQLVPMLNSDSTDQYGFPIVPAGTPYTGVSNFLSHSATKYDNDPMKTIMVSANAMQLLPGYPYMSISLNDIFKTCFNVWCCGLAIEGNVVRIEHLSYFFDDTHGAAIDLLTNVSSMKIEPLTEIMNCFIQSGYAGQNTNSDFGVDAFNKEIDFNTPLTKVPGTNLNLLVNMIAEMYAAEKTRAQQVNSPIPSSPLPGAQSGSNDTYLFELDPSATPVTVEVPLPDNSAFFSQACIPLKMYPNAQNVDPTAAVAEYIYGLYYPDTAINLGLTPGKNLRRLGAYLHSMLDGLDNFNLVYQKIYQMLYNDTTALVPGIQTNLTVGVGASPINEVYDIPIVNLDAQLFRPYKITLTTASPVNMYSIMTSSARNRYIQWTWKGVQWKGYIVHVDQNLALRKPTSYELWAHPSVTNAMMMNA